MAQELNAQKIPTPSACWNRRVDAANRKRSNGEWVRTAIVGDVRRGTGILNNPIYKGDVVWGRSRWERSARDSSVRRWSLVEDASQVVSYHDERLRIVPDELWSAVQPGQERSGQSLSFLRLAMRRG